MLMWSRCSEVRVAISLGILLLLSTATAAQEIVPDSSLRGRLADLAAKAADQFPGSSPESRAKLADFNVEMVLMGLEVSTAPYGMSTGSFTFIFDSELGTFVRSTETFGPIFGKRSLTVGKGRVSAGFNWLHARYDSIGGLDLTNGDFRWGKNAKTAQGLSLPISYSSILMDVTSDTYVGVVNYGVTNNFDIGVVVPWVRVSLAADLGLFNASGQDVTPGAHQLALRRKVASGVGDIAVFGKYRFWQRGEGGLAAEIESKLPSGDTNDLRGVGVARTLVSVIWSQGGNLSPHANVGYEIWSKSIPYVFAKNQINYVLGLELKAHSRVTATVDLVGRRLLRGGQIGYRTETLELGNIDILTALPEGLDVISFGPGIKWNVAGDVIVTTNMLASIANRGVRAKVIPVVGFEWAF